MNRKFIELPFLIFFTLVLAGCTGIIKQFVDMRGYRYCEILFQFEDRTDVWGTQGLNRCPADEWDQIDFDELRESSGAVNLIQNGPRYFVVNSSEGMNLPEENTKYFGNLEMRKLATVEQIDASKPYTEVVVMRDNTWKFDKDNEIYELSDPSGNKYVMQSFSQILDKDLEESDLSDLRHKIDLPSGWRYEVEILDENLFVHANGNAIVIQDNLFNTYQKL